MPAVNAAIDRHSGDLRVFMSHGESRCGDCGDDLGRDAMIVFAGDHGALCLACADLDHLTLASGDASLTRRARKYPREDVNRVLSRWRKE